MLCRLRKLALNDLKVILILCLIPISSQGQTNSKSLAVAAGEYPFLVLVQINNSSSGDSAAYLTGCLVSQSWVLSLSSALAQLTPGPPSPSLRLRVYAGLTDFDLLVNSTHRSVNNIVNTVQGSDNKYFPNLVLLQLNAPFPENNVVRPVVVNVGEVGQRSVVVGWAYAHSHGLFTPSHVISMHVVPADFKLCDHWQLIEFSEQMCGYAEEQHKLHLGEGALLLDSHCLTAIKQFDTYLQSPLSTKIALFVRISYYTPWIQSFVVDQVLKQVSLQERFGYDPNKKLQSDESVDGCITNESNCWTWVLLLTQLFLWLKAINITTIK